MFVVSVAIATGFGVEFVPKLDEGDIAIQATRLPSVSLEKSIEMTQQMERCLLKFPEVQTVVSKTGRPEIAGLPYPRIIVDRDALARYGVNSRDVRDVVATVGGHEVGQVFAGQRRFPIQVRLRPEWREDARQLSELRVEDGRGRMIPLSQLATIRTAEGPVEISRDAIRRRLLIQCNVRGRDLAGFVAAAREVVDAKVPLPPGYSLRWGGQFENLQRASRRLAIAVPVALFLIFAVLYVTFHSVKLALLIYLNVPIAATGGILLLWARDIPFSISAGVGFIALFGIAVMTATCGALGFVPMALSSSSGAEVQRPLATVVIGGLVTSTLLTLLVLPAVYRWFEPGDTPPANSA